MNIKLFVLRLLILLSVTFTQMSHASEGDLYDFLWLDPDKEVYVLQNKVYQKKGTFYINAGYIIGMGNEFQDTNGGRFSAGYYFTEELAFEIFTHQYKNTNSESYLNLEKINSSVPFVRRFNSFNGAMIVWSPFYGKINTFNKIFYFDWSLGAGLGQVSTESNALTAADPNQASQFTDEKYTAGALKTGVRFHVTPRIHVDIEYFRTHYSAPGPTINGVHGSNKLRANSDLIFSLGLSF